MDLQIALLSAGVCVICAVVVYLISVFGIREKTYEEAIEEQRKRNQEAAQHSKVEKPKKEKKFKKQSKRTKESRNSEEEAELASNHVSDHVEFKPDAEIIPPEPDPDVKPQRSKKKVKAPKSILLNKQDVGPISSEPPTASDDDKDVLDAPPSFVPMDEVERRHSLDIGQKKLAALVQSSQSTQETTPAPAPIPETQTVVTETKSQPPEVKVQPEVVQQEKKHDETTKKNKKQRLESFENETELSFKKLLGTIKKLSLVDEEIQTLIDVLLNKQQGGAEWHKKNDPVAALKKQLTERETALEGEQKVSQMANNKLREVRQELTQEKARYLNLERTLRQELQSAHSHLQATVEQKNKAQQAHSKALEEQAQGLQCMKEEKVNLQQQLQLVEVERQKWGAHEREIQREFEERYQASLVQEQERMNLQIQAKESQLQQVIVAQQEGDYQCSQAIQDLKQKLQETQSQLASVSQELDAERSSIRQRLEEKEMILHKKDEDQQRMKRMAEEERLKLQSHTDLLQGQVKNANNQMQDYDRQLGFLREEADSLRQELAKAQEQKQSLQARGDTHNTQLQQEKNLLTTRLAEAEEALEKFRTDLAGVHSDLEAQKSKNNELRERNWKAMDAIGSLEKSSKEKEEGQAQEIGQLRQAHQQELMQLRQQLQDELHQQGESKKAFSEDQLQRIWEEERSCLQRVLPDIHVDSSLEHSTWLERFAECVKESLASTDALRTNNDDLGVQINHYQTVLSDTEGMLKNLQKRVEDQEKQWAERLARKEAETTQVLKDKAVLEEQLQQLQGIEEATAEMQGRLKELQAKLQGEENEKKQIETKAEEVASSDLSLEQAVQRCASLTSELENLNQEVSRLREETGSVDRLTSQVEGLQKDLEKERKITKELGSQVVKLNSLLKIGQDALRAEQELVKQLEKQMTPCANGNNNNNNNNNNNKIPADNGTAVENDCASTPVRTDKPNKGKKRGASGKK